MNVTKTYETNGVMRTVEYRVINKEAVVERILGDVTKPADLRALAGQIAADAYCSKVTLRV